MAKSKIDGERYLTAGEKVEVRIGETRKREAWYIATIITPPSSPPPNFQNPKKHTRLRYEKVVTVEYEDLVDVDGVKKLRQIVDVDQVRPIPPTEMRDVMEFEIWDSVDCFMNGGWHRGSIMDVNVMDDEKMFGVSFNFVKRRLRFYAEDLRIHRDWIHGDWLPPFCPLRSRKREREQEITEALTD